MNRRRQPAARDRGSVIVETALLMPFLALMMVGITEYALAFRSSNHLDRLARNAMVELLRAPADPLADYRVIETVRESTSSAGSQIKWVMVYKANPGSSDPPSHCVTIANSLTSGASGVGGLCNVYSGTFVASAASSDFGQDGCTGAADRWMCPATRRSSFGTNQRIGVAVRWTQTWKTKLLPGGGLSSTDFVVSPLPAEASP